MVRFGWSRVRLVFAVGVLLAAILIPAATGVAAVKPTSTVKLSEISRALSSESLGFTTLLAVPQAKTADLEPLSTTYVYITRTGSKYHRHYCVDDHPHTRVTLHHAKSHHHLGRCKVCKPPK